MMARQESNVVEVLLPFWDSLDKAEKIMRKFGDVGGVNVLNSKTGLLEIAYWDIRAAQKAVDQLGVEKCRFGPPCGNRRVRLPGTASLDHSIIDKISMSEMRVDDRDSSYYTLVFYDIRECKRFCDEMENVDPVIESSEKLHNEWVEQVEPRGAVDWRSLGASNNWWGPPGGTPGVWKAEEVGMTSIAEEDENSEMDQFPSALPGTYSILLQGIPSELLNRTCVTAILEQAGLANDVLNFTLKGREIGLCVLVITSQEGVCRCLNHFAGCRWGARATLINGDTATMPNSYPLEEARREASPPAWNASEYNPPRDYQWLADEKAVNAVLPRVPQSLTTEGQLSHVAKPTSEASTDVQSESEEETISRSFQGRSQHFWHSSGVM